MENLANYSSGPLRVTVQGNFQTVATMGVYIWRPGDGNTWTTICTQTDWDYSHACDVPPLAAGSMLYRRVRWIRHAGYLAKPLEFSDRCDALGRWQGASDQHRLSQGARRHRSAGRHASRFAPKSEG